MSVFQSIDNNLSHKRFLINRTCDVSMYHKCDMESIGEKIRAVRESVPGDLSQQELAKRAGVSQTTIADLERGRNESSRKITNIARELFLSAEELEQLPSYELVALASARRNGSIAQAQHQESELPRKSSSQQRNPAVTKAIFDLLKELDRGDLSPEMQSMLTAEIESKVKIIRKIQAAARKKDHE